MQKKTNKTTYQPNLTKITNKFQINHFYLTLTCIFSIYEKKRSCWLSMCVCACLQSNTIYSIGNRWSMFCIPAGERRDYCVRRPLCLSAGRHQTRPWVMLRHSLNSLPAANSMGWERLQPVQHTDFESALNSSLVHFHGTCQPWQQTSTRYDTSTWAWKWKTGLQ